MKKFLILLLFFNCIITFSQNNDSITKIEISISEKDSLGLYHIEVFENMDMLQYNPRCSMDIPGLFLKDSLPNGEYEVYHNKELRTKAFYLNNKKNGVWIYYWNDTIEHTEIWENGKRINYKNKKL